METSANGWPPGLITFWCLLISEQLYMLMLGALTWFFRSRGIKMKSIKVAIRLHWFPLVILLCETRLGLKGQCHDIQWLFALFCARNKWRLLTQVSRTSDHDHDDSSVSCANSFTAQAESRKCRFPRAIIVFCGLALWPPLFFPTQNGCQKSPIIVTLPV